MSQTQMNAVQDGLLENASKGFIPKGFIAKLLFPTLFHAQYSGKLAGYGKNHLRIENTLAGGKSKFRLVEPIVTNTTNFNIDTHGLSSILTKRDYKNRKNPFDVELDEVMGLMTLMQLAEEYALAQTLADTAIMTQNTTLTGTSQFSDKLNSDPLSVFETARKAVHDGCGIEPDTVVIPRAVYRVLRYHPQLLDSLGFKENRPGGLNSVELASALDVRRVLIPDVKYNSAKEGQSDSMADLWGKHIILGVCPDAAQKWQVSLGYNVVLEGESAHKVYKNAISNPPNSTEILVEDEYDKLLADVTAGYLIKDAIA
jgi:hypothetical protein